MDQYIVVIKAKIYADNEKDAEEKARNCGVVYHGAGGHEYEEDIISYQVEGKYPQ